jgi:hypothetical protein
MARLFILFLIALLPLRAWSVERMAFAMQDSEPAPAVLQASLQQADTGMGEECALHMQMASSHDGADAPPAPVHKGCQACQLCMPLAALDNAVEVAVACIAQTLPLTRSRCFVSADPAQQVKPPIS